MCHTKKYLNLTVFFVSKHIDLGIILPMMNSGEMRVSYGYRARKTAVDYIVHLITDVKCAKLLVEFKQKTKGKLECKSYIDSIILRRILTIVVSKDDQLAL